MEISTFFKVCVTNMKGINNVYSTLMLFRDVQYTCIDPTEEVRR